MKFHKPYLKGTLSRIFTTSDKSSFETSEIKSIEVKLTGFPNDRHEGLTKSAAVREKNLYPADMEIKNHRIWSALSEEEFRVIEENMELGAMDPGWIGANMMFKGIPAFSKIPPLSRIRVGEGEQQCTFVVYEENHPCTWPHKHMERHLNTGVKTSFAKAALGMRGLVGWVEREGRITEGDSVEILIPQQWPLEALHRDIRKILLKEV